MYVETDLGRLDLLGETPIGNYAQLVTRAEPMQLGATTVKVIALDDLIAIKQALGRPKDKLVEAELRAIRERLADGD